MRSSSTSKSNASAGQGETTSSDASEGGVAVGLLRRPVSLDGFPLLPSDCAQESSVRDNGGNHAEAERTATSAAELQSYAGDGVMSAGSMSSATSAPGRPSNGDPAGDPRRERTAASAAAALSKTTPTTSQVNASLPTPKARNISWSTESSSELDATMSAAMPSLALPLELAAFSLGAVCKRQDTRGDGVTNASGDAGGVQALTA
mmetsp:Transcript_120982/g.347592  ORF Transcript_120982/g.347592 Transcript_120982/m.347592 type:complete len:205 (+) Transcript_120982:273-887(+)